MKRYMFSTIIAIAAALIVGCGSDDDDNSGDDFYDLLRSM